MMRIHMTGVTKMWLLTSLAFFYVVVQYHVSNTWQMSAAVNNDPVVSDTESDSRQLRKLWLRKIVGEVRLADEVQNTIGDQSARELADRIYRYVSNRTCTNESLVDLPVIYIVTPTYRRPEQMAELTRLAQTLMHVKNIYWLLIEDAKEKSASVKAFLNRTGIRYIHLVADTPLKKYKGGKPKGVNSRIKGLKWIRENVNKGVLYFADDDNTYDLELFKEMRYTKKVAMWPVGLVTQTGVSSPLVKNGKVVGFYDGWIGGRKFPVDMAGFAVNISFLKSRPKATMAYKLGYEEDSFLQSLAPFSLNDIEPKAENCTKVLVWHTQTKKFPPSQQVDKRKYANTNLLELKKQLV